MENKKIRIGILGAGNIAQTFAHASKSAQFAVVTAIGSRALSKAESFAEKFNIPNAYGSYNAMLESQEIDAVYNSLPNSLHAEWMIKCINKNIPVICEKPFTRSAKESKHVIDTAKEKNVILAEAFMYRFHPMYKELFKQIKSGVIGNIKHINSQFSFMLDDMSSIAGSKELAGGALLDVGCYCVDVSRRLADSMPVEVVAVENRKEVDLSMSAIIKFENGITANFVTSIETAERHFIEIIGTNGYITIEKPWVPGIDYAEFLINRHGEDSRIVKTFGADCYTEEMDDFAKSLLGIKKPEFDIYETIDNMSIIDALFLSAREKKSVRPSMPKW